VMPMPSPECAQRASGSIAVLAKTGRTAGSPRRHRRQAHTTGSRDG
jgi:hypothetical protein